MGGLGNGYMLSRVTSHLNWFYYRLDRHGQRVIYTYIHIMCYAMLDRYANELISASIPKYNILFCKRFTNISKLYGRVSLMSNDDIRKRNTVYVRYEHNEIHLSALYTRTLKTISNTLWPNLPIIK